MAAVEVTISGVLYDKTARTTRPVVLIGEATLTGLGIGGGPMPPGEEPPQIWGPTDPRPGYGLPGGPPPRPAHPIVLPPEKPTDPPTEPPTNPPDPLWDWAWNPNTGWIPAYVPGDKPHPPVKK